MLPLPGGEQANEAGGLDFRRRREEALGRSSSRPGFSASATRSARRWGQQEASAFATPHDSPSTPWLLAPVWRGWASVGEKVTLRKNVRVKV